MFHRIVMAKLFCGSSLYSS